MGAVSLARRQSLEVLLRSFYQPGAATKVLHLVVDPLTMREPNNLKISRISSINVKTKCTMHATPPTSNMSTLPSSRPVKSMLMLSKLVLRHVWERLSELGRLALILPVLAGLTLALMPMLKQQRTASFKKRQ